MKLAAIQFKGEKAPEKAAAAGARLEALVEQAGAAGAQVVVCPEMALTGYLFSDADAARAIAEPATGSGLSRLAPLARRHGMYVVQGYAEAGPAGALYNAARVIDPRGELVCSYRKRLLYSADQTWAQPGDTPYPLVETPYGTLAVGICMDLNDDRFTAFLRTAAPRLVAFCTNWVDEGFDPYVYWRYRLRGAPGYFVAANTYGWDEAPGHERTLFSGRSAILGPGQPEGRSASPILSRGPHAGDTLLLADIPEP